MNHGAKGPQWNINSCDYKEMILYSWFNYLKLVEVINAVFFHGFIGVHFCKCAGKCANM